MLYISRCLANQKYSVVDTDDGVIETVDYKAISNAVKSGITIHGVKTYEKNVYGVPVTTVLSIGVYQGEDPIQPWQTKLKVLMGVEILVAGGEITQIKWDSQNFQPGTVIRLSDYCKKIGSYAFLSMGAGSRELELTIKLDDKLKLAKDAFSGIFHRNVVVDLNDVTKPGISDAIYNAAISAGPDSLSECIIDSHTRSEYWQAVLLVMRGVDGGFVDFPDSVRDAVKRRFKPAFRKLLNSKFNVMESHTARTACRDYVRGLDSAYDFWRSKRADYTTVRLRDQGMLMEVGAFTTLDSVWCNRLMCYIWNFEMDEELQKLYARFVLRVNNQLLDYGVAQGWIMGG